MRRTLNDPNIRDKANSLISFCVSWGGRKRGNCNSGLQKYTCEKEFPISCHAHKNWKCELQQLIQMEWSGEVPVRG
jgi:hypothetical protein